MINGVFTEAPLPPSATPRSEPAPGRRDIATQCDLLGIEAPRSRAPGAPIPLDQLRAQAQEAEQKAKACGVEMAKRAFVAKVLTLVAASAVLITAALITGLTAGAGVPASGSPSPSAMSPVQPMTGTTKKMAAEDSPWAATLSATRSTG